MVGRSISHYRIDAELGRGGMGVVYRAHDAILRRDVALKVLSEQATGGANSRARILAEARAASSLNHPAIVTVYEVGEDEGNPFIVMELLSGETLRARLSSTGPLDPRTLTRLGAQAAAALDEAHARGVIHGDIKPENMIVLGDGRLKILDFGLARHLRAECTTLTEAASAATALDSGGIAGTIAYMAPEQLRGESSDARADLYSLGVVLYELALARRPFIAPTAMALMDQVLNEGAARLHDSGHTTVPAELARIVHKLIEKRPESRYQSARELQVDLNNLLRDIEVGSSLAAGASGRCAVAVLPFRLLTPSPEDEYLSVALADAVISHLGASGELLVRPVGMVLRYAKQSVNPLLAARELNVKAIVDGSIQRFGSKLRVHIQAWDASSGATLLTAKHDSDLADLFLLEDRLAEGVARALGFRLSSKAVEHATPPTKDPDAYQLYLRAVERLSRFNRWDTRSGIEMLEEALRLDPRFSDAWALLGDACMSMSVTFEPKPAWVRQAERATRRALALDPGNAAAHCSRGRILWSPAKGFQHRLAAREINRALRLRAGFPHAHLWRCIILTHVGLHEQARQDGLAALAVNPEDSMTLFSIAHADWSRGEFDGATEYFMRAITADSSHLWAHLFLPLVPIYRGDFALAEEKLRSARQVAGNDAMVEAGEALLWARRGETRKALQSAQRAMSHRQVVTYTHHACHAVAATFAQLGKPDQALSALRKAARVGLPDYPLFRDDRLLTPLRKERGFLQLMTELKRTWNDTRREFEKSEN
jgi:TolB-like protein/tetratricopeptide (TPR) repeat protein